MPRPEHKPESHILAAPVTIEGLGHPIKGIFDGGAETCIMSFAVYMAIDPRVRPTLRASEQQVRGVFGVEHTPLGEITLKMGIPSLHLVAEYDVIVDNIEDDLILDNSFMVHAQIDNLYAQGKLVRGPHSTKAIPCVSRVKQCRRISLQQSVIVAPHSRQILPGKINFKGGLVPDSLWLVEPAQTFSERTKTLAAHSICNHSQICNEIPVEVYNPGEEPVQILKDTTIGLISPARLEPGVEPLRVDKVKQPVMQTGGISFKGPRVELPEEHRGNGRPGGRGAVEI